jgi:C-terminal processing protease CtpA/Prc
MAPADCEKMMRAYYKSHGWLGIEMDSADGVTTPVVTAVTAGGPAEQAGFKVGDVLTSINGIGFDAKNAELLMGVMDKGFQAGQKVTYTAKREAQIVTLTPVLAPIPDANLSQMIASHLANSHKSQEKSS